MIDSHAHLTHPDYGDEGADALLARAGEEGVDHVVCVAYDIPSNEAVIELSARDRRVSAVVGIHPHESDKATAADLERMEELARRPEVVGVGETGLDFYRDWADPVSQRRLFREQLAMAGRVGKPVVIHDRDAHDEVAGVLAEHAGAFPGGVMHCFSGDVALMEAVLPLGFYVSIPGPITFSKKDDGKLADVVRECPEDRLLIETDCPWLTPAPHRGKRNEPAHVRYVLERVARIRGRSTEEMDRITEENTRRLFRLEA
ncbi:MAG: TatD family hydrolase [Candidatus Eisenbacteria bacterium]